MRTWWRERSWLARVGLLTWPLALTLLIIARYSFPAFGNRSSVGCYWTDAMIVFVECKGTGWDELATFIVSLPMLWLSIGWAFVPLGVATMFNGEWSGVVIALLGLFWAYAVWQIMTLVFTLISLVLSPPSRRKD